MFSEAYEITDPECTKLDSFRFWLDRERAALERLYRRVQASDETPVDLPCTFNLSETERFGSQVDNFKFLDMPMRRVLAYHSSSRPENNGVGRLVIRLDVLVQSDAQMTPEEQEAQRRSFAYGNVCLHNCEITRKIIDEAAEQLNQTRRPLA